MRKCQEQKRGESERKKWNGAKWRRRGGLVEVKNRIGTRALYQSKGAAH